MTKLEDKILEQLEKEAKEWIEKEYRKRQELVRQEVEKQVTYAQEHDGHHSAGVVRSYHERAMGYAMKELRNEVEFEADQWIIEEMGKRLEAAKQERAGQGKADAETQERGDTGKKDKAKTGTKAKTKPSAKTKTKPSAKTKS
jgi:hypothetical protein